MSEERVAYQVNNNLLRPEANRATMDAGPPDIIQVSRADLLKDYGFHLARAQHLAKLLGLPPLPTGQQLRKAARER